MASRRKPAPRVQSPSQEPILPSGPADPQLPRYSLSDAAHNHEQSTSTTTEHFQDNQAASNVLANSADPFLSSVNSPSGRDSTTQSSRAEYKPYQPGQYLAPIMTGETLKLESEAAASTTHSDPFYDPTTPVSSAQTPLAVPSDYYYGQPQEYEQSSPSYISPSYGHESLPASSEIDHFNYDTEAYASGNYSRAAYRPPRSRSPTPAVDDEDYLIVGDNSVHYTGYPDGTYGYDAEKEAKSSPYYTERGYLPTGQTIVYDPEPETPTSTLYSLPPETPLETRHFGPAPAGRIHRRHKTKRRVQLTNGNLVVDLDVPPKLVLPRRGEPETMKTRYTAVTCDPDDFEKSGFFLRQNESGRRTELFIVITMYNVGLLIFFTLFD